MIDRVIYALIEQENKMADFREELQELLNRHSKENTSNTPDYILRRYLTDCLDAFDRAVNDREDHYGRKRLKAQTSI